jgi:hypothetical protein
MLVRSRLAAVAGTLALLSAGLVTGATATTVEPRAAAPGQTVQVTVKQDHTLVMPETLQPGVTAFRVSSRRFAGLQIVQPDAGYTKRQFARDVFRAFGKNNIRALRRFEARTTLWGGVFAEPRKPATMAVDLPVGTYWALDVEPPRIRPAKIRTIQVAGETVGGTLSGQVIRAVGKTRWSKVTPRVTRKGTILFENRSSENHFVDLAQLKPGKTMKDFRRWINQAKRGEETSPPVRGNVTAGTGVLGPGQTMSFDYALPRGSYVLVCFWPDAEKRGMPHAFMGMYRGLRIG